jgi:hypothetical protein
MCVAICAFLHRRGWGLFKYIVHVTLSCILGIMFGINLAGKLYYESRLRMV